MVTTHKLYRGEVTLTFDDEKHVYKIDGEIPESVTGFLKSIAKPQLIPWAAGCAADYIGNKLVPGIGLDEIEIQTIVKEAKVAHKDKAIRAAKIGTLVHSLCEEYAKTGMWPPTPVNDDVRRCLQAFERWVKENKVEFISSERRIYSKIYDYAGTCDFIAKVNGETVIGDLKTSTGIYKDYWPQVAAYQYAIIEEDGITEPIPMLVVNIRKDGTLVTRRRTDFNEQWDAARNALELHRWMKKMEAEKI